MELVYLVIGAVLGAIATAVYFNHDQEKKQAEIVERAPMSFAQMYAYTLERFSNPSIPRLRQTHTLLRGQRDLLDVLGEAGGIVERVRMLSKQPEHLLPKFLVNLHDTEFDRNGCVELWVDVSDDVSEVYYLRGEHLPVVVNVLSNINATFNKQLVVMTKGIVE